eukprot:XP_001704535.1 Hypothetical protein GL50803_39317 [Giardia lamblia ATCC 50803]
MNETTELKREILYKDLRCSHNFSGVKWRKLHSRYFQQYTPERPDVDLRGVCRPLFPLSHFRSHVV